MTEVSSRVQGRVLGIPSRGPTPTRRGPPQCVLYKEHFSICWSRQTAISAESELQESTPDHDIVLLLSARRGLR